MNCHHLAVHGERHIRMMAATRALEWHKRLRRVRLNTLLFLLRLVLLLLQLILQIGNRRSIESTIGNTAMLESSTVETRAIVIVSSTDDLATTNDDAAVTVVERGLGSLLEAESQVVVGLHFDVSGWVGWA